tara:strand:- start:580 stop:756 length:177 start_codon:yes stop_codon:yes gene_type:complete
MKGKMKEDVFTSDGALYKGDVVIINVLDQLSKTYQVETKIGKLFTIKQNKVELLKNEE